MRKPSSLFISVNPQTKTKSILIYQHLFYGERCFPTYFDLHDVIIRRIFKNSMLVLELCFYLMWVNIITIYCHFDSEYYLFVKYSLTNTKYCLIIYCF
jgi:hypothetical protein